VRVEAITQERNTLVVDSRNLTSKYWKIKQGDLSSPIDHGNNVKVFMWKRRKVNSMI
jgi:hypothetical protein